MSTAIDADRNAQSGYIAEDEQTKPEMLTQPITLRISTTSRSKTRSIAVMGVLKLLATPAVAFVLVKLLNPPPTASGVIVLFAAMPTGANAYIFAARYQRLKQTSTAPDFDTLIERALAGEEEAKLALRETARYLAIGISNLVVGFSPEAVIVGGEITRAWPLVEKVLTEKIERSVRRGVPSARILRSTLNGDPTLLGALSLILARKFAGAVAA